jgi:hypothetical protein
MIAGLEVPYRDTSADALCWVLGLPVQRAHAVLDVRVGRLTVQLRVLGASHQVLLRDDDAPAAEGLSETVACLPGAPAGLPPRVETLTDGLDYRLTSDVRQLATPADFDTEVSGRLDRYRTEPHALVGSFPGHPFALTVLVADPEPAEGQARWSTWHTYPRHREIVSTSTTVHLADVPAGASR